MTDLRFLAYNKSGAKIPVNAPVYAATNCWCIEFRVKKVGAVSMVARATDFSFEFKNSETLENLRETSALSLFCLCIEYTN